MTGTDWLFFVGISCGIIGGLGVLSAFALSLLRYRQNQQRALTRTRAYRREIMNQMISDGAGYYNEEEINHAISFYREA